jgi:hypothetical protein
MGVKIYTVPWTGTVTNAGGNTDLWEILPGDDLPCKIRGFRLGQTSELGDTAEESLRVTVRRMRATVTSGSGGSAGAPEQVDLSNQAPGFSSETNNTTVATTSGDSEIIEEMAWNIRNSPFEVWYPDPDFAPKAVQGEGLFIRCESTVADDITFCGTIWIEEG